MIYFLKYIESPPGKISERKGAKDKENKKFSDIKIG
jgi:hypothetical protein